MPESLIDENGNEIKKEQKPTSAPVPADSTEKVGGFIIESSELEDPYADEPVKNTTAAVAQQTPAVNVTQTAQQTPVVNATSAAQQAPAVNATTAAAVQQTPVTNSTQVAQQVPVANVTQAAQ